MNGRIIGPIAATIALIVLWFVALGLFTSWAGLVIAGVIAIGAGATIGVLVEPRRAGRNTAVVAVYIGILVLAYLLLGQTAARYAPRGSQGGAGLMPVR